MGKLTDQSTGNRSSRSLEEEEVDNDDSRYTELADNRVSATTHTNKELIAYGK